MSLTPTQLDKIRSNHTTSFKGIREIIKKRETLKKWPFISALVFSIIISIAIGVCIPEKSFTILQSITDVIISVFPSLLGFSLGGYAIVIGFSNSELLKKTSEINEYSVYQILSAIFAISILFQVFITIIAFFVSWMVKVDLCNIVSYYWEAGAAIVNILTFFILLFGACYSLMLTPYVVFNLFTLGQMNSTFFTIEENN